MQHFNLPGMKVLVFAFGEDNPNHPYLPHNFIPDCVVYSSTHDTNTVRGWFENEARPEDKARLFKYLGHETTADQVSWEFIALALNSAANTAIIPFQDVLGLGQAARMNQPATAFGNWKWRVRPDQLEERIAEKLMEMTRLSKRI
jgi:4-alpha-glucanotransferase